MTESMFDGIPRLILNAEIDQQAIHESRQIELDFLRKLTGEILLNEHPVNSSNIR